MKGDIVQFRDIKIGVILLVYNDFRVFQRNRYRNRLKCDRATPVLNYIIVAFLIIFTLYGYLNCL